MRVLVTCGPSYEPIDAVRRLTNFSTGELGTLLANRLARAGFSVLCLRGVMATHPAALDPAIEHLAFSTNDDLLEHLRAVRDRDAVAAVFHAAALCDFRVKEARGADGCALDTPKIPSRAGELTLLLEPATKLIAHLRPLFPRALLVGWKYELAGTRAEALEKGRRQLAEHRTDLCVVNGAAFGEGFGVLGGDGIASAGGKDALAAWLTAWLGSRVPAGR
jgi:phosphopantothenate---cysteine ligase (CTP)